MAMSYRVLAVNLTQDILIKHWNQAWQHEHIAWTNMVEGENQFLRAALWLSHVCAHAVTQSRATGPSGWFTVLWSYDQFQVHLPCPGTKGLANWDMMESGGPEGRMVFRVDSWAGAGDCTGERMGLLSWGLCCNHSWGEWAHILGQAVGNFSFGKNVLFTES